MEPDLCTILTNTGMLSLNIPLLKSERTVLGEVKCTNYFLKGARGIDSRETIFSMENTLGTKVLTAALFLIVGNWK